MVQIGYSELTKRFYFLPAKGSKVDITNDVNEIISAYSRPSTKGEIIKLLKEARDAFVLLSLIDKSELSKEMVDKIEKITQQNELPLIIK